MTTTYTTLLGYALPETGTLEGLWGDEVNDNITQLVEDSVAGYATASVAAGDWTLTDTGSGVANEARMMILIPTGSPGVSRNIIAPAHSKMYVVVNQSDATVVLKGAATTGATIQPYYTAVVVWNGADFEEISPTLSKYAIDLIGGAQGSVPYQSAANTTTLLAPGTAGQVLTTHGAGANPTWETPTSELPSQTGHSGEYLTTNGSTASWASVAGVTLTGVTNSTSPFLTALGSGAGTSTTGIKCTFVGYHAGNLNVTGVGVTALGYNALPSLTGDYSTAIGTQAGFAETTGGYNTSIGYNANSNVTTGLYNFSAGVSSSGNVTGSYNIAVGSFTLGRLGSTSSNNCVAVGYYALNNNAGDSNIGIGYQAGRAVSSGTTNTIIGYNAGYSGTNNLTTGSNNIIIGNTAEASSATVSNEVTLGNSSITSTRLRGMVQVNAAMLEQATVSATAATGTINYDARTQSVLFYTSNASANWTLNVRGSSTASLDSVMATGQSLTIAFLVTQGSTAYYQSALTIDGTSVTPKWQGGTTPVAGNASSVDIYVLTIIKTGSATFSAFASQTKFA